MVIVTLGEREVTVQPLFETPYHERWPVSWPDGRWLAYGIDVSGQFEVWDTCDYIMPSVSDAVQAESLTRQPS